MNTKQTLTAARALIADRDHWCQGAHCRAQDGEPVSPHAKSAHAYCAEGALIRITGGLTNSDYVQATDLLADSSSRLFRVYSLVSLNDGLSIYEEGAHGAVLRVFDDAIAH